VGGLRGNTGPDRVARAHGWGGAGRVGAPNDSRVFLISSSVVSVPGGLGGGFGVARIGDGALGGDGFHPNGRAGVGNGDGLGAGSGRAGVGIGDGCGLLKGENPYSPGFNSLGSRSLGNDPGGVGGVGIGPGVFGAGPGEVGSGSEGLGRTKIS
jgi:hypothetical protein